MSPLMPESACHSALERGELILERESELFNDGVSQHFAGHALNLRLGFGLVQAAVQCDLEVLALAHVLQTPVSHLLKRSLNGFTLGIQDTLLKGDVNESSHREALYVTSGGTAASQGNWSKVLEPQPRLMSFCSSSAKASCNMVRYRGWLA